MKKIISLFLIMLIIISFCSCEAKEDEQDKTNTEYLEKIIVLQTELVKLNEKYEEYADNSNKRLEELTYEVEALKKEESETTVPDTVPEKKEFVYDVQGDVATLTGYDGSETILVIPSHIDGYPIIKIGEKSLAASKLTTVIISDGVKEIDWFAFMGSPFLCNVTIPKSVTKIGYSAFDGCSSSLTIYCERGSYAHSYAESFGIPYVLT